MSNHRKSDWPIYAALTVLVLLLAALGAYVGCYFGMSETHFQRWDEDEDGGGSNLAILRHPMAEHDVHSGGEGRITAYQAASHNCGRWWRILVVLLSVHPGQP